MTSPPSTVELRFLRPSRAASACDLVRAQFSTPMQFSEMPDSRILFAPSVTAISLIPFGKNYD